MPDPKSILFVPSSGLQSQQDSQTLVLTLVVESQGINVVKIFKAPVCLEDVTEVLAGLEELIVENLGELGARWLEEAELEESSEEDEDSKEEEDLERAGEGLMQRY